MNIFKDFFHLLTNKEQRFFIIIVFLSILQAMLEILGIASVIPFITFLFKPESLGNLPLLSDYINFENINFKKNIVFFICTIFFMIFFIKNTLIFFSNYLIFKYIFSIRERIYNHLLEKVLNQSYLFFIKEDMSKIFNTTFQESNNFSVNIVRPIINMITELIISLSIIILIIFSGYSEGLLLLIPIFFFISLFLKRINKSIKTWANLRVSSNKSLINLNFNLFSGIREIFIYAKEKLILKNFQLPLENIKKIDTRNNVIVSLPKILLEQSIILVFVLLIIFMVMQNKETIYIILTLSFYLVSAYRLVPSINKIFVAYQQIKFGKVSIKEINKYLTLPDRKNFSKENKSNYKLKKNLVLENINFAYDKDRKILNDINLKILKNECIGIMGESGSGKSTLLNIITGLILPNSGKIIFDDQQIDSFNDKNTYQSLFSLTSQDTFLINKTIKENIIFGSNFERVDDIRVNDSLKFANLIDLINQLPDGVNSDIGTSIKKLSSGQKQRIAIARAYYIDKSIMIFDEATNALDEKNESIIIKNIKKLKHEKNIILISHNPKILEDCDSLYELKDGKLKKIK